MIAFDSKQADGYHWYLLPGQLALGEDDDHVHVLLSESEVSLLLFKDENGEGPPDRRTICVVCARSDKIEGASALGAVYSAFCKLFVRRRRRG